jgi:subtilase family serine protease
MLKFRSLSGVWGVGMALFFSAVYPGITAERQVLHGHVPPAVARFNLQPTGQLPATKRLHLAIGLPLRNKEALDNLLQQIYDPASPNYHQYLTPEQFTEQFGPTEQDYQAVINFAQRNHLTVMGTSDSRMLLDVSGSVPDIERAFQVKMRTYRHPAESREFYAPDVEPSVEAGLSVADVSGLNNYALPHPKNVRIAAHNQPSSVMPKAGSGPLGNYIGNDFRAAYVPGTTLTGAGQMVGLVQFDGFYSNDITAYETKAGLPAVPLQTVLLDGYNGTPTTGANSGNIEVSLDIEMAMSMAPGLSKIVLFEAGPSGIPNDVLNAMAASNTIKNLSCSWGWSGGPSTTTDNIFKKMATQGQSFFNASDDSDAFTTGANSVNGVDNTSLQNTPSSSPYITQVGGTTLSTTGPGGSWSSETVWNWGVEFGSSYDGIGSSGGISSYYSIPIWQTNINMTSRGGSATQRNIPDVALTADAVFVKYGNGLNATNIGGTSCAAPLWAGFMALVNQQAAANGNPSAGLINPAIYTIAAGPSYSSCFHDITTGNNTWSSSPNLFYATNGYDLCTGLGTPAGQNLINALAGPPDTLVITPASGFAASGAASGPFNVTAQIILLTNSGAASLNWTLANASLWLNVSPGSGTLASGGQTTVTANLNSAAYNLAVGTYSANVWFTNQTTGVAQLRQFALQVFQPLAVSPTNGFTSSGPVGGSFSVTTQNFSLNNMGAASLNWSVNSTASWLTASPNSGALSAGGQTTLTVSLNSAANSLASGTYNANVVITNQNGGAVALPFTLLVGQPLVQNGGFEAGTFTSWTQSGNTAYTSVTSGNSRFVHSGTYGAALGPSGSLGYLSQTLPTFAGQNYLLSLWVDSPNISGTATPNEFSVSWNGSTIFDQVNVGEIGWTNLQFIVTATGSSTVLQLGFRDDPYYLGLDDISVTPIPVPAFRAATKTSSTFSLTWGTMTGLVYQVQYNTNLLQTNWINLGKPLVATNDNLTASDTNAISSSPQRFYRLMVLP